MLSGVTTATRRFRTDERGAIAVVFSLTAVVLVMMVGLAIDIGRIMHASTKLAAAADAAALAGARALRLENLSDGQVKALTERFFRTNATGGGGDYATIESVSVAVNRASGEVAIDVQTTVHTLFAVVAGIETIDVPKSAAAVFASRDVEVGLQLDVTGSMLGGKLRDLKSATKELVDTLIPDAPTGQNVKIGFAPFSAGVNAGNFARAVNGNRPSNGCTYERLNDAESDATPVGRNALKIGNDLPRGAQSCPNATVLPMTSDKGLLKRTVDSYQADGSTAGHLGTAWAWYLLSPNWASIWPSASAPAPYRDGKTTKVAVLMTDGIYNTIGGVSFGDNSAQAVQSSQEARTLCRAMKNEGILVYTVGFQLGNASLPIQTLRECASEDRNFFRAENGQDLRAAFREIGEQITTLRLSR
jgi:Flp pilus assembly protein TadG